MDNELVDQVFADAEVQPPAEVTPPAKTPAPAPEPAPAEPPAETPAPTPEPPSSEQKPDHFVPLPKYLDTRDERNELRKENARLKAEMEARATTSKVPDPIDDPDGHTAYLRQEMATALQTQRLEVSEELAIEKHGQEKVDAAVQWALAKAQADPTFGPQYMRERNPIDWLVRQHEQSAMLTEIGTDRAAWIAAEAAKMGWQPPAAQGAAPAPVEAAAVPPSVPAPPRSIASDATAPATVTDEKAWVSEIFDRK